MNNIDGVLPFLCFWIKKYHLDNVYQCCLAFFVVVVFSPSSRSEEKPMESGGGRVCSWQEPWHML